MITREEAWNLVVERFQRNNPSMEPVVEDRDQTIERSFGWVFFYQSKRYVETKKLSYLLVGNPPILVNRFTGEILSIKGRGSPLPFIEDYERKIRENSGS
jgi:hypothetical protein